MNKEVGYIVRGFLLMLVILAGLGFIQQLLTSAQRRQQAEESPKVYITNTDNFGEPLAYNVRGKKLFDENCETCHKLHMNHDYGLPNIEDRVKDKQLLRGWIRNSDSTLKTGDRYFNKLYEDWGKTPMPPFPQLSDEDIDEILEYIWRHRK